MKWPMILSLSEGHSLRQVYKVGNKFRNIGNLDNMFQFTWLLLDLKVSLWYENASEFGMYLYLFCNDHKLFRYHLGGEEESSCCDIIAVELCEAVEHVEPLHVDYRCVDA